jgi:hypothetical protein
MVHITYCNYILEGQLLNGLHKLLVLYNYRVKAMVFNVTFNNISVILWSSLLLVEETGEVDKTDHSQVTDKLYHIMLY